MWNTSEMWKSKKKRRLERNQGASNLQSPYLLEKLLFFLDGELDLGNDFAVQLDRNLVLADGFDGLDQSDFLLVDLVAFGV